MSHAALRDPGLQPERTRLAWRRTSLALAVATLAIGRLVFASLGSSTLVPMMLLVAGAVWVLVTVRRRSGFALSGDPQFMSALRDGRPPLVVAAIAATLCLAQLLSTLVQVAR